jgi:hypothetical protein
MSSFIVTRETIEAIVRGLDHATARHQTEFLGVVIPRRPPTGIDTRDRALSRLGDALWRMNASAVNQRYAENEAPPAGFAYKLNIDRPTAGEWREIWEECQRFDYQCHEGDVPESPDYRDWLHMRVAIAEAVIMEGQRGDQAGH